MLHFTADPVGAINLRLDLGWIDLLLLFLYFVFVIGIGLALKRAVRSSTDFFLSGRSLPAWITGLAFISANLGALEILGMAGSAAKYGVSVVHYYWIGAIPAMVFLGIVMMPFYYGSKVRSVPEYLRLRFDRKAHLVNAVTFVLSSVLIAGVNLYALATVIHALLGISLVWSILLSAGFVLSYILLGGLSSAIYNEVLQFFIILAGLIPLTIIVVKKAGGVGALIEQVQAAHGPMLTSAWAGTEVGGTSPFGDLFGIVAGLGFCLSFGYWTTNFAEVQRAMSAKDTSAARLTPIIGSLPKIFIPLVTVLPGLGALILLPGLGQPGGVDYTNTIPALMAQYLPAGALGVAVTGLVAAFMAGMAANVSSFNAVFTYDIWQSYLRPGRPDAYYLKIGRIATVGGVAVGIGTAFIAAGFSNIMDYFQLLFSFFNVPLFVTFALGMFWKRASRGSGFLGILVGTVCSVGVYLLYLAGVLHFRGDLHESFWGAIAGFVGGGLTMAIVSWLQRPVPAGELAGLVYTRTGAGADTSTEPTIGQARTPVYRRPVPLGLTALVLSITMYVALAGFGR
jgi:SSS family solute:Na+ symporter